MRWQPKRTDEYDEWWETLPGPAQEKVAISINYLELWGPSTRRPLVGTLRGSKHLNMKELRADPTIRVFFAFDPRRKVVLLIGGDKAGKTKRFYRQMIAKADKIYDAHLRRIEEEGPTHGAQ